MASFKKKMLPNLGTNLVTTLASLQVNNLSHFRLLDGDASTHQATSQNAFKMTWRTLLTIKGCIQAIAHAQNPLFLYGNLIGQVLYSSFLPPLIFKAAAAALLNYSVATHSFERASNQRSIGPTSNASKTVRPLTQANGSKMEYIILYLPPPKI